MSAEYLIAHDLGTSGVKAALTDLTGRVIAACEHRYPVYYSADGGAEQDPDEWWAAVISTTHEMMAMAKITPSQVVGMSMDAQMVGTVPVDRDGNALRRVMIWLDARAQKEAEYLVAATGLPFITGKAPSAKVLWIKNNEPEIYAKTYKFLDCKDYMQLRMTGEYGTDLTLAIATTYLNPATMDWWEDVLAVMDVPVGMLPPVMPSTQVVGKLIPQAAQELGLVAGIPVVSGGGDVPCAVIGSGAISPGRVHLYLGTSAWVFASTNDFILDAEGVSPGVSCNFPSFLLGGEMDNAGGCLKWFAENLLCQAEHEDARAQGLNIFAYIDQKALSVPPGADGLLFLPWVWGERNPVDDDLVRGGFAMLGLNHTKWHMGRAILEGVGHHLRWIFNALEKAGIPPQDVNVIGGGANSHTWLQILANVTDVRLRQVEGPLDACARGAAMTAAVGLGIYPDFSSVEKVIRLSGAEFSPDPALRSLYDQAYVNFRSLYPPLSAIGKGQAVLEEPVSPAG
jgi:xylulokinase